LALRHRLPLRGLDGLLARDHPLTLLRLLALRLALWLHRLTLRGLDGLLAGDHSLTLLRLLALRLALWLHRLTLRGLDGLLAGYHSLAPLPFLGLRLLELGLGRRGLWLRLLLRLGRRGLWLRLLLQLRRRRRLLGLGLRLLWRRRRRRLLGLRLPWRRRRRLLLRLRLRLWWRGCGLLLRRCLRDRLLRLLLLRRFLRARMLRVLTAPGRGGLGNNDGPRRGRGRDAFGAQEPLRQGQRGHRRDRQQGVLSRCSYLQNLRQFPLLDVAAPFNGAHAMNRMGTR
jgi:hypothetical protein